MTIRYDESGSPLWVSLYDGLDRKDDDARAIAADGAGRFYVTGQSAIALPSSLQAATTVGYDLDGRELWVAVYPGAADLPWNRGIDTEADHEGNVFVLVDSRSDWQERDQVLAPARFVTLKYDRGGRLLWERSFGGSHDLAIPHALTVDSRGRVVVTGQARSSLDRRRWDYATVMYDGDGTRVWEAAFDGVGGDDFGTDVAVDLEDRVIVTGYSEESVERGSDITEDFDYLTIQYDPAGAPLWMARYDGRPAGGWNFGGQRWSSHDHATKVATDAQNNVYVTGWSEISGRGPPAVSEPQGSSPRPDIQWATLSYSPRGAERWRAAYAHDGIQAVPYGMALDERANVYITGEGGDFVSEQKISNSLPVVKYSTLGREVWTMRYLGLPEEAALSTFGAAIAVEREDRFYVAGTVQLPRATAASDSNADILTLRYTPLSFIRGDCNTDGAVAGSIADAVFLLRYLFLGGHTPGCLAACDADGDGEVSASVTDALFLLHFSFAGGRPPLEPYPDCAPVEFLEDQDLGCFHTAPACE